LADVVPSSGEVAVIGPGPLAGVPLAALAGDQQAATFGQACFTPGQAKNTYGTGCFLVLNTGTVPVASGNRLLTTVGWQLAARSQPEYAREGSIFTAGADAEWRRDGRAVVRGAGGGGAAAGRGRV